jgi:two-component system CheB/CheR fusion protein
MRKQQHHTKTGSSAQPLKADRPAERRRSQKPSLSHQDGIPPFVPIVGIGASAGGLEAFTRLLRQLPLDTGLGFVLVQHLDPEHESALTQILTRATKLPVREATDLMRVEGDHVYIIPPNTILTIEQGCVRLEPRRSDDRPQRSIDVFFESLAHDQRGRAIGVILSGTASDGTVGLEAIKAESGITFAQDESAKYDSMPRNAVAAGCVDFVLSPEDIAKELARIAKHPYGVEPLVPDEDDAPRAIPHGGEDTHKPSGERRGSMRARPGVEEGGVDRTGEKGDGNGFKQILLLLHRQTKVDFSLYKQSTIQRRITRRMVLTGHTTLEHYLNFLRDNPKELHALYADALISVTSFFRNQEAFDALAYRIIPDILRRRSDDPFRLWVLGCSTGQEAYSIAMAITEGMDQAPRTRGVSIFATDLNDDLLATARRGFYAKNLVQDVSPERLRRFFYQENGGYRIVKELRDMVVFARQNLVADPPFSRMDLISCRNVLIYLEPSLQKRAIQTFHYALKPGGYLLLGTSESIGSSTDLFEPVDKKHKLYQKEAVPISANPLPVRSDIPEGRIANRPQLHQAFLQTRGRPGRSDAFPSELTAQQEADRITLTQFAPPSVLIDSHFQILQFRGTTEAYLKPPKGKANFDLLKMAREGLVLPLRAAINQAKKGNSVVRRDHVRLEQNGRTRIMNLKVVPLRHVRERCFLVVFEDSARAGAPFPTWPIRGATKARRPAAAQESHRLAELERDLADTRDYLQSIQEQYEAGNEELQASNEEVQSANEELQSLNEELETSKEELESANEELTTVNEEMVNRNAELTRLNADWLNLQNSTNLPVVVLGRDLTIRRFTAQAETLFGLRDINVGQPIGHIQHSLTWDGRGEQAEHREPEVEAGSEGHAPEARDVPVDMESVAAEVIATIRAREFEVRGPGDRWHLMRVRPYLTLDNKVDGAVLVLSEITELKRSLREALRARNYAEAIIETGREPLLILDGALRVERANRAFYRMLKLSPAETIGHMLYELGNRQWDSAELRSLLQDILPLRTSVEDFQVIHSVERLGPRTILLNARRLEEAPGSSPRIFLSIEDITLRQEMETHQRDSRAELENKVQDRTSELVRSQQQLRALTTELNLTEQREHKRLATELHDFLAQLLALSKIKVDQIKQQTSSSLVEELDEILDQALTYTRTLVAQLSPPFFHDLGLPYAFKWLGDQMEPRGLRLTVEAEDGYPSVADDHATLLFQAARELLMNVVKHAGTDHARLAITTADGTVRITVSDDGRGFDVAAAMAPAADDEQASRVPGFGLFSIRERMLALGGRFELVSRPGDGTLATLIVPLPLTSSAESAEVQPSAHPSHSVLSPQSSGLSSTRIRVLLVDDHAMVREGLRTVLDSYPDIEVVGEAADGKEAVAAADHLRPSVVVMDINMPRMNGIEATAQIKARHPAAVVIGLSVQADAHSRSALLEAGAAELVTKEAAAEELYRSIHEALGSHRNRE